MNSKEQAQIISAKLQEVCREIDFVEKELYTTAHNRDRLVRLKRVRRALSHDLDQLVKTISKPIQFALPFPAEEASAPPPAEETDPLNESAGDEHDYISERVDKLIRTAVRKL